jgi:hypothetical protein
MLKAYIPLTFSKCSAEGVVCETRGKDVAFSEDPAHPGSSGGSRHEIGDEFSLLTFNQSRISLCLPYMELLRCVVVSHSLCCTCYALKGILPAANVGLRRYFRRFRQLLGLCRAFLLHLLLFAAIADIGQLVWRPDELWIVI